MTAKTYAGFTPEEAVEEVERIVGYTFHDKGLIMAAITHPSAAEESSPVHNYERLEFLGDSILGAVVAEFLFERYPGVGEGGLTRMKVSLVSGATLSQVASEHGFDGVIVFGESETGSDRRGLHSALENVYESVVAALYLDGGIGVACAWVERTLSPYVKEELAIEPENPKSALQELLQAHQKHPEYEIVGTDGPPHDRVFFAQVTVDGEVKGEGEGHSKKEAEAEAAKVALSAYGAAGSGACEGPSERP